jgi:hypothetical protein
MSRRMSAAQRGYIAFVAANPGVSTAEVDRACRRNPHAGHKWVYDGVKRLVRRKFLKYGPVQADLARGGAVGLYVVSL